MRSPRLPIPESFWVVPEQFLAGEYPGRPEAEITRHRLDAFLEAGFDTFIDLTRPNELPPYDPLLREQAQIYGRQVDYQRHPIHDFGIPTHAEMVRTLDALDAALAGGRKVYLHCWGGVGRTGTTVGCYLVRHGKTGEQALAQLNAWWQAVPKHSLHPRTPEIPSQMQFILDWQE